MVFCPGQIEVGLRGGPWTGLNNMLQYGLLRFILVVPGLDL